MGILGFEEGTEIEQERNFRETYIGPTEQPGLGEGGPSVGCKGPDIQATA